jgi:uncharacterized protein
MNQGSGEKVESFAKGFKWTPKDYYWKHTLQTREFSLMLQKHVGGDPEVVELASLLHDIGKASLLAPGHEKISAELSKKFLDSLNISKEKINKVVECILYEKSDSIESQILKTADSMSLIMDTSGGKEWYFENVLQNDNEKIKGEIIKSYKDITLEVGRNYVQRTYEELIGKYS